MVQKPPFPKNPEVPAKTVSEDAILKIAKEIAIKFIEVGRLTPSTFDKTFKDIHRTIEETVEEHE
ncbi:MAG: hypothetical protein HKP41_00680 [Desulfobacterales bacterium]|nr:hypothetical protein [Deltaproteobacteria bacterium]NNK92842.1 hypothetical protein [Desulfobacterales bacterium]